MAFPVLPFGGGVAVGMMPIDLSAAAQNTLYVNARDINGALWLLVGVGVGTAGDNLTVNLQQAKTNAGGSAKTLNIKEVWFKAGGPTFTNANASTNDVWTKSALQSREAPASSYATLTDRGAATNQFVMAVKINPADLDAENGFTYVRAQFTDVGANAQLGFAVWLPERFAQGGNNLSLMA